MDEKKPSARSRTRSSAGPSKAGESAAKPAARRSAAPQARASAPSDGLTLLDRAAKAEFPASLYIEGDDEAAKAAFLSEFRRAWAAAVPEAPLGRILRPGENGVDEILAAYHNVSMFTPRELTIVLDIEELSRSEKKVEALAAGIAHPAGQSCVLFVESAADNPRKSLEPLRAVCAARWIAASLSPRELQVWGERRLAAVGVKAEPGTLEALVRSCEGDSVAFFNELSKLVIFAQAGGAVGKAELARLSRPTIGADLEEFLAAVAAGHAGIAAQRLGRLLVEGESEGGLLFLLGNITGGALGGWTKYREIAGALRSRRQPHELAKALDAVYRAEAAWKSGRIDARSAVEAATREIAAG